MFEFNSVNYSKVTDEFILNQKHVDIIVKELLKAKTRMDIELRIDLIDNN